MAPEGERRGDPESGKDHFEGRDLLVGRPEGPRTDPLPAPHHGRP